MKRKKHDMHIGISDYIKANRMASRKAEIEAHGKQVGFRHSVKKSVKDYNRNAAKRAARKELSESE